VASPYSLGTLIIQEKAPFYKLEKRPLSEKKAVLKQVSKLLFD